MAEKLANFPLLRLLIFKFWFRLVVLGLLLGLIALGLFLPKMWRTSPPSFLPVIRISGLDWVQARSLQRGAVRAQAEGQWADAVYYWRASLANNPANPDLCRGLLRCLLEVPEPSRLAGLALGYANWLLRLSETNQADLALVAQVYERTRLYDPLARVLEPVASTLNPTLERAYLKALFRTGRIEAFSRRWTSRSAALAGDPSLALYEAAFKLGWGVASEAQTARQRLEAALEDPQRRLEAGQLRLLACLKLGDPDEFARILRRLQEWREDTPGDHALYWRVLAAADRQAQAVALAREYGQPPTLASEALLLADVYFELDLRDLARQTLQRSLQTLSDYEAIWMAYASLLWSDQRWEELSQLALRMRQDLRMRDLLSGLSYFWEGRAAAGEGRLKDAEQAFQKVPGFPFKNPMWIPLVAQGICDAGFPAIAREVVRGSISPAQYTPEICKLMLSITLALKQEDLLLPTAEAWYRLAPDDTLAQLNYASSLLTLRRRPQEAIALTLKLLADAPQSAPVHILHSMALLQNQRAAEAAPFLQAVNPARLRPQEAASYHLALVQMHTMLGQFESARRALERVDTTHLFPAEIQWLNEARQQLPTPPEGDR